MEKEETLEEENLETEKVEDQENNDLNEVEALKLQLEESQKEIEELKDRLLRRQAEFENFRKRTQKEKQATVKYASEELMTQLLPSLDNFGRALEVEVDENSRSLYEGVEMVYKQFLETLENNGLEEIECLNEEFDHNCHHAVTQQESDDCEPNTVIKVLGKGYRYKDKVIRPSMVMVSK